MRIAAAAAVCLAALLARAVAGADDHGRPRTRYGVSSDTTLDTGLHREERRAEAVVAVDVLYQDLDTMQMVAVASLESCTEDGRDCADAIAPVYLVFDTIKLEMESLYIKAGGAPAGWNVLVSTVASLFDFAGQIGEASVHVPNGECERKARKDADGSEVHRVFNCRRAGDVRHDLLRGALGVDYEQTVTVPEEENADIVSVETVTVSTGLHEVAAVKVASRTHITQLEDLASESDVCAQSASVGECLHAAGAAELLASSWAELVQGISSDEISSDENPPPAANTIDAILDEMAPAGASSYEPTERTALRFIELVRAVDAASEAELRAAAGALQSHVTKSIFAAALAAGASDNAKKVAEAGSLSDAHADYLRTVPFSTGNSLGDAGLASAIAQRLLASQSDTDGYAERTALAALLSTSQSVTSDNSGAAWEALLNSTWAAAGQCGKRPAADCSAAALGPLANAMGTASGGKWTGEMLARLRPYLCSKKAVSDSAVRSALDVIGALPVQRWPDWLFGTLDLLARNRCAHYRDGAARARAAALLLAASARRPAHLQSVLDVLREPDSGGDESLRELKGAILAELRSLSAADAHFAQRLKQLKAKNRWLANNWDLLATGAKTSNVAPPLAGGAASLRLGVDFAGGHFNGAGVSLQAEAGGGAEIIGLRLFAQGLQAYLGGGGASTVQHKRSVEDSVEDQAMAAGMQATLFGTRLPRQYLFRSQGEAMNVVFGADGTMHNVFQAHLLPYDSQRTVLLASGHTLRLRHTAAVALRLVAGAEVSLWGQNARVTATLPVSHGQLVDARLADSAGRNTKTVRGEQSAAGAVHIDAKVDFGSEEKRMCIKADHRGVVLRWNVTGDLPARSVKRRLADATFRTNEKVAEACKLLG